MKHLSIKWSLTAALVILLLMIGLISGLGFYSSTTSEKALQELAINNGELANAANRTQVNALRAQTFLDRYASFSTQGNPDKGQESQAMAQAAVEAAEQRFDQFRQVELDDNDPRAEYVDAMVEAYDAFVTEGIVPLLDAAPFQIQRNQESLSELGNDFDATMEAFTGYANQRSDAMLVDVASLNRTVAIIAIVLLVIAVLATLIMRTVIVRVLVTPLREAVAHFERIASGDLTADIEDRGRNEVGQLYKGLAYMQTKLKTLVISLRESSDSVFSGTGDISAGSLDLSARTEQQAAALQETASSMEQMATTVSRNTETAQEADQLSVAASQSAEAGGQEVAHTVQLMRDIASSAERVNDIIGVIDSIAFQTNILALNASVEAARAGEQGRGFAVVASEVRQLASRSADSAKEIRQLIEATTGQINQGAAQAERSGETINDTVDSIRQVTTLVSEISTATREQNSGIEQINAALTEMDSVTQQNAALVQQTNVAAASLEGQAKQLAALMATFRLEQGDAVQPSEESRQPAATPANGSLAAPGKETPRSKPPAPAHHDNDEWDEF
ncbi:MAG: methyl-accepting chemotaxis protein [Pseudomonadota bacterium]